jgi:hypothetical protein
MTEVGAGPEIVPRLRRSHGRIEPQPFRAGLTFWLPALRTSHPWRLQCDFFLNLQQAVDSSHGTPGQAG